MDPSVEAFFEMRKLVHARASFVQRVARRRTPIIVDMVMFFMGQTLTWGKDAFQGLVSTKALEYCLLPGVQIIERTRREMKGIAMKTGRMEVFARGLKRAGTLGTFGVFFALLCGALLVSGQVSANGHAIIGRDAVLDDLDDALAIIGQLEFQSQACHGGSCVRMNKNISKLERKLRRLKKHIRRAPSRRHNANVDLRHDVFPYGQPAAGPVHRVIDRASFSALLAVMRDESFADDKLRVVRQAARDSYFMVDHVLRILDLFSFGDDKLKALKMLAPRIYNPAQSFRVYEAFDFDSDRDRAAEILGRNAHRH